MKQILRPDHPVVWRSIAICTVASAIIAADALIPIQQAEASYEYSKVDRHCVGGISRQMSIDLPTAARLEASEGLSIDEIGLARSQPYCWLADKTAPNGTWSQAAIFPIRTGPIAAPPQVLVVYFATRASNGLYTLVGTERWNVGPSDWRDRFDQSAEMRMLDGARTRVESTWQNRDRLNLPAEEIPECR